MVTQPKVSIDSKSIKLLDLLLLGLGIVAGSAVALAGLWLWFNYKVDPGHNFLAIWSSTLVTLVPTSWQTWLTHEAQVMGLPLTDHTQAYWYMARAGGFMGYLLLWLSVIWGLVISSKIVTGWVPAPIAFGLHEFLSIGAILFTLVHAVVLLGDQYLNFNIFHLAVPFVAPFKPVLTGLGTIGFYLTVLLTGSFYVRKQLGQKVWRMVHYLTFVAYGLALVHGLMIGTDSGLAPIKVMYLVTGAAVLFLTYYRLFTLTMRKRKPIQK
jgi:predicted ferric reductase